jgi:hypothetical protein
VKVLIVDDQAHGRYNLIWLCWCRDDLQVVGEAACGQTAIDAAGTLKPDINARAGAIRNRTVTWQFDQALSSSRISGNPEPSAAHVS